MAVPMESSAKKVAFGGFTPHVAWLRFAWHAWQGTWFCVAGAIQLSWQASTLDVSIFIFAWQAQHFSRVVLRVFCASHCHGCLKW